MFDILDMGASGLQAQRTRLDTIAGNILHANTTRNERGEKVPYKRRFVVFAPGRADDPSKPGVHVSQVGIDNSAPLKKFEPGHPDADADGYVYVPNIDTAIEYVNSIEATRAYEANITMMEVSKSMFNSSLRLIA
ncbi:MAG: flagellar basal-body rod protein FlgC [Phycisphaerales bacterium]|jgi:flagellar basal-body rod protein FlgC|nr:flagellar basal-body rod protein FlgC [Phycisphaerales bacterium]MDB5355858.1 flagellar basal-body rod protein FlgC [Phycisphaerales bacterium]